MRPYLPFDNLHSDGGFTSMANAKEFRVQAPCFEIKLEPRMAQRCVRIHIVKRRQNAAVHSLIKLKMCYVSALSTRDKAKQP